MLPDLFWTDIPRNSVQRAADPQAVKKLRPQSGSDSGTGTLKPLSVIETRQYRPTR